VSHEVLSGPVSDAIADAAQRWQADVIVTGSRGNSVIENAVLGSVSQSLLERSQCPVLVGRDIAPEARGNVLLPIDDSRFSAAAVEWLAAQEWANTCTISLISVLSPKPAGLGQDMSVTKASENLLEYQHERFLTGYTLQQWAIRLQTHLPGATIHHGVFEGDARGLILKAAHNWPAALVVMGSHGRTGLSKLVVGSVSQYVAANARCCVAIVKGVTSIYYDEVQALIRKEDKLGDLLSRPIDSGNRGDKPHVMPFHMM
jgi:nucleotide-binding universal stress UspA family protein